MHSCLSLGTHHRQSKKTTVFQGFEGIQGLPATMHTCTAGSIMALQLNDTLV